MRAGTLLGFAGVLGLVGCGGPTPPPAANLQNAFTGTLTITGAIPPGTTTCLATHVVTLGATGADLHLVTAGGGDCVTFMNGDPVASHQPASIGTPACPELDAPGPRAPGVPFTTHPLAGPKTCLWQDLLNPPTAGAPGY
jgi:hypothetical protein